MVSDAFSQRLVANESNNKGALVRCLAVIGPILFAGTTDGLFRSSDNGSNWIAISSGLLYNPITALAVSGKNLFVGTASGVFFGSTNYDTNWTPVDSGLTNHDVCAFAVIGTTLFAGTDGRYDGGVYRSTNDGKSWSSVLQHGVNALAVIGKALFAGGGNSLLRSTDGGTSWEAANKGLPTNNINALMVNGTNLFAGINGSVFLSTDNGASWNLAGSVTKDLVKTLAVNGKNLFAGTLLGAFISTNNGKNWYEIDTIIPSYTGIYALAVSGKNLFVGTERGLFRLSVKSLERVALNSKKISKNIIIREKRSAAESKKADALLGPDVIERLAKRCRNADRAGDIAFHINAALGMQYSQFSPMLLTLAAMSGDIKEYFQQEFRLNPKFNDMQLEALSRYTGLSYDELKALQSK